MGDLTNKTPILGLNYGSEASVNWNWARLDSLIATAFQPDSPLQLPPGATAWTEDAQRQLLSPTTPPRAIANVTDILFGASGLNGLGVGNGTYELTFAVGLDIRDVATGGTLMSFDDAGVYLHNDPTVPLGVATKQYVDTHGGLPTVRPLTTFTFPVSSTWSPGATWLQIAQLPPITTRGGPILLVVSIQGYVQFTAQPTGTAAYLQLGWGVTTLSPPDAILQQFGWTLTGGTGGTVVQAPLAPWTVLLQPAAGTITYKLMLASNAVTTSLISTGGRAWGYELA